MPFALVFVGLVLIVVGAKGTHREFGAAIVEDFTGQGNFIWWIAAIGAVGALGYVPQLRKFSIAFMSLILVAMLLNNGGFFQKFTEALQTGPQSPKAS